VRGLLLEGFRAAVAAANPLEIVASHLPRPPRGRTFVAAAGKAAAAMALAVERAWPQGAPLEGIAVTRYRHALPTRRIRVIEAAHPVPDAAGEAAARAILAGAQALGPDDLLLALISGGGSALLALPAEEVPMEDLRKLTRALLASGATIQEINTVRKHLSAIQGGRLAAACRAPVLALLISDVTGDDPTHIASGPCAPDPTSCDDARAVLARYGIDPVARFSETPKPGDEIFARVENRVIATARRSLDAAGAVFRAAGVEAIDLGDAITGEAAEVARDMARQARGARRRPVALISGGECTVTLGEAGGRGGRCSEFLLALALELEGVPGVHAIAADTDGIDGTEDNAGALLGPDTLARARALGMQAREQLARHDSYGFFAALGDLVVTGPTRTNVNDFRAIVLA
jgi:hydroxypyruvate reductase